MLSGPWGLPLAFRVTCCRLVGGVGVVVGNRIVDASIFAVVLFEAIHFCFLLIVGSQGRSVDALAPGAEEGRCSLRYASGSWQASFDPRVSEWGNLAGVVPGRLRLNS